MEVKIGKFNFVSDHDAKFYKGDTGLNIFDYFYLDGKEDTLFVYSRFYFDNPHRVNRDIPTFEEQLAEKYYIFDYSSAITNGINRFLKMAAYHKYDSDDFSRYELYNKIRDYDILHCEANTVFNYCPADEFTRYFDTENTKILTGKIVYDPYKDSFENLEELYQTTNIFNSYIKAHLITLDITNGTAPPFVKEITKINEFLKKDGKKTATLLFKDGTKAKILLPEINAFLYKPYSDNDYELNLGYYTELEFPHQANYTLSDVAGLAYRKDFLEINPENLMDIDKQLHKPTSKILEKDIVDDMFE